MLLQSIARRTLGLKDHRVIRINDDLSWLTIYLEACRRRQLPCQGCGRRAKVRDRLPRRCWQHVPLWGLPVLLVYAPCRVACPRCGIRVEAIPWSRGKSPLSLPLVVVLATYARLLAWDVVAKLFAVSWSTVVTAVRQAVDYGLAERDTSGVLYVGIDEISRRRRHIYHTQVYDLGGKRLLWSGEGREAASLERFFQEWGPERCQRLQGICCDMWAPYIEVIRRYAPQAILVFDKFHLIRHLLDAVDKVRREEVRALKVTHPGLLEGSRYIWLKNPWNLTGRQRDRLRDLERLNLKIMRAYLLKELFRELWRYRRRGWAKKFLLRWLSWASRCRLKPFVEFGRLVRRHLDGILAWFQLPLDNGLTEAMNNNAKAISHRAHGFRTAATFTLALLHGLGKLELPKLVHKFS